MNSISELEKTNIKIIDDQHEQITNATNTFFGSGAITPESFEVFLSELKELVKLHFSTEEKLMIDFKYENYYSHKQEHDRFLRKVNNYSFDYKEDLFIFINDWLNSHLVMKDQKLGKFLLEKSQQ